LASDGWFVGYTPALSTAVWVGGLGGKFPIILGGTGITGGRYPARIWGAFMNAWQEGKPAIPFPAASPVPPRGAMLEVPGGRDLTPPPAPPPPPPDPGPTLPFPIPGPPGQAAQAAETTATTETAVATRGRPPPTQTPPTTGIPT
jgi:membrane peptidoglycan carboxypeptidase